MNLSKVLGQHYVLDLSGTLGQDSAVSEALVLRARTCVGSSPGATAVLPDAVLGKTLSLYLADGRLWRWRWMATAVPLTYLPVLNYFPVA